MEFQSIYRGTLYRDRSFLRWILRNVSIATVSGIFTSGFPASPVPKWRVQTFMVDINPAALGGTSKHHSL